MRRIVVSFLLATVFLTPATARAHGDHEQGDLVIVTGFAVEPAFAGSPNGVQLIVTRDGEPVTNLKPGDLSVDVSFGDQTTTLALEPWFAVGEQGTPGEYRAPFIPGEPEPYTFHVTGSVDGEEVDYELTSGPKAFAEVEDPAAATFPATQAPAKADLAARIERESARTTAVLAVASDTADQARLVAIVAVVVAVVALGLVIAARRRPREQAAA